MEKYISGKLSVYVFPTCVLVKQRKGRERKPVLPTGRWTQRSEEGGKEGGGGGGGVVT